MKRNPILRILSMMLGIMFIFTVLFFVLSYFEYTFIINMSFKDYLVDIGFDAYKEFIQVSVIGGDWGYTVDDDLVTEVVFPMFGVSFSYVIITLIVSIPIGLGLGALTAIYKGSWFDKIVNAIVLTFGSLPTYLLATAGVVIFWYGLHIFPYNYFFVHFGFYSSFSGYVIPVLTLSFYPIARTTVLIRGEILESLTSEHFELCRAKGLTRFQTIWRHSFRESLVPFMPALADLVIFVVTGSFIVEVVYRIPGVGALLLESLMRMTEGVGGYIMIDTNTILLIVTYYLIVCMLLVQITDIAHKYIDPRIRYNL